MPLIPVTINVLAADNSPLEEARVSIWAEDYSECVYDDYTDNNGQTVIGLAEGVYHIFLKKIGFSFEMMPKDIETTDVPVSVVYRGTAQLFPSESNGLVYLYGDIKDINLNPIVRSKVQIYLTANPQIKQGAALDKTILEVYTDEAGRWGTLLPSGCLVTVIILSSSLQRTGTLPFVGPINVLDLV